MDKEITARMKPDGLHVFVDEELALIVENDPDDLVLRTPSNGCIGSPHLMFSIDDAVTELFGALDRQNQLGLNVILSVVIFSAFEEQEKFTRTISQ